MPTPPPVLSVPPKLPPRLSEPSPISTQEPALNCGRYLDHCAMICFIMAAFIGLGAVTFGVDRAKQSAHDMVALIFVIVWVVSSAMGGLLLIKRKKIGQPLAMICFAVMLPGIPVGTIFGVLGFTWLKKGRHLLA